MEKNLVKTEILKQIKHYASVVQKLGYHFSVPYINWDLKGRIAGKGGPNILKFNLDLASQNIEKFLVTTVPHEMAHVLQMRKYPNSKPHGKEWKFFCVLLTGKPLKRCHSYSTTPSRTMSLSKEKFFCNCKEHFLTLVRANRLKQKKYRYFCKECKGDIKIKSVEIF